MNDFAFTKKNNSLPSDVIEKGKEHLSFPYIFGGNPEKWIPSQSILARYIGLLTFSLNLNNFPLTIEVSLS